jgi:GcrA cell cycle regulator
MTIWTDEKRAEVAKLWQQGFSATIIGRQYGVSRNSIIGVVHRMGLSGSRAGPSISMRDSAKWSPELDDKLREMAKNKASRQDMADVLGFTYNQVLSRTRTLKISIIDARSFVLAPFTGAGRNGTDSARRKRELGQSKAPARIVCEAADPNIKGCTVLTIPARGACRWPLTGSGADLVMCGQRSGDATYCGEHEARAYNAPATTGKQLYRSVRRYA